MRRLYNNNCDNCGGINSLSKSDAKEICSKIHLFGFSFMGGIRFYTFRELFVSLGFKRQAVIWKCVKCNTIKVECPYCGELHSLKEGREEKCKECARTFYICV